MVTLELPNEYGFVLLSAVSTFFISGWLGMRIVTFRKAAKVPYPYEYASYEQVQTAPPAQSKAMLTFNAAQRAHQNFNENHVNVVGSVLVAGLVYPRAAAAIGFTWSVNRVLYAVGYTREVQKGRYWGALGMIAEKIAPFVAAKAAWDLAMK